MRTGLSIAAGCGVGVLVLLVTYPMSQFICVDECAGFSGYSDNSMGMRLPEWLTSWASVALAVTVGSLVALSLSSLVSMRNAVVK